MVSHDETIRFATRNHTFYFLRKDFFPQSNAANALLQE